MVGVSSIDLMPGERKVQGNDQVRGADKKRPNTIPVSGPGKWLFESRALKVGINAGEVALPFKGRPRVIIFQPTVAGGKESCRLCDRDGRIGKGMRRSRLCRAVQQDFTCRKAPGRGR